MQLFPLRSQDNKILKKLQEGDEAIARQQYDRYAGAFINWARKNYTTCPEADIVDAYQEAFTNFYFQARDGKLREISTSIKAYLFAIGKNKIRDRMKKVVRLTSFDTAVSDHNSEDVLGVDDATSKQELAEQQRAVVRQLLNRIGDPCRTVLHLAFFQNYPPESIARAMGYTSELTARVRKTRCLKQLGDLLEDLKVDYTDLF